MERSKLLTILGLMLSFAVLQAQVPTATLTCRAKQVQVGMPFEVELTVRHPERMIVVFPDSARDFKPYEVESGVPLPTNTDAGMSEDGKIYQLYTWEIDSIQHIQFPVYYLTAKGDTEMVLSNMVDVEFLPTLHAYSDTLKVRVAADLVPIKEPINWLAWGIVITVVLLVAAVTAILLRKPIRNWMRRARIEREWRRYQTQVQALRAVVGDQASFYAGLNKVWRGYLDRDWRNALGARTTQELEWVLEDLPHLSPTDREVLLQLAMSTDMVLYAGRELPSDQGMMYWNSVFQIMLREYQRRKEAVEV